MFGKAGEEIERGMSWHAVEAVEKDVRTCAYLHFLRESSRIRKHILRNRHQASSNGSPSDVLVAHPGRHGGAGLSGVRGGRRVVCAAILVVSWSLSGGGSAILADLPAILPV